MCPECDADYGHLAHCEIWWNKVGLDHDIQADRNWEYGEGEEDD